MIVLLIVSEKGRVAGVGMKKRERRNVTLNEARGELRGARGGRTEGRATGMKHHPEETTQSRKKIRARTHPEAHAATFCTLQSQEGMLVSN